ncbi:MAG: ribokinase, partial [Clostridia bacterium]|nr:ribokinase [Clostridia bacterium]
MKILNFGSLNIDHVYQVAHFVQPGETLGAAGYQKNAGGKGLNQSIALARAGVEVCHAGQIGEDGLFLKELLEDNNVSVEFLNVSSEPTGHAIIQVNEEGQNCILIYGGANQTVDKAHMQHVFSSFESGDFALFQNEMNDLPKLISMAAEAKMKIVLNPSPIGPELFECDLSLVDYFIMNEIEG